MSAAGNASGSVYIPEYAPVVASDREGAKTEVPFDLIIEKPVGYVDSMTSKIMVFPNPTSGVLALLVSPDLHVAPYVEVFDFKGSIISKVQLTLDALNRQKALIDLSAFPDGLYLLRFLAEDKVFVEKVLVMRAR